MRVTLINIATIPLQLVLVLVVSYLDNGHKVKATTEPDPERPWLLLAPGGNEALLADTEFRSGKGKTLWVWRFPDDSTPQRPSPSITDPDNPDEASSSNENTDVDELSSSSSSEHSENFQASENSEESSENSGIDQTSISSTENLDNSSSEGGAVSFCIVDSDCSENERCRQAKDGDRKCQWSEQSDQE